jgi:hypothetical protein
MNHTVGSASIMIIIYCNKKRKDSLEKGPLFDHPTSHLFLRFHVGDEVNDTVGVSSLVIIPRNKLDEIVGKGNSGLLIKDGRAGIRNEIGRDDILVGVSEDTSHGALRSVLDGGADGLVRGSLLQAASQVHNGDIDGWDTERHTGKFSVQFRDDLADGLGGSSGRGDDVVACGTSSTPVLAGGSVNSLLSGSDGVDGSHETLLQAELVVDDLGQRSETIGGARGVGDNIHGRFVFFLVDSHDEHGSIRRRSRDDNLLGSSLQVRIGRVNGGESTGRLHDVIGTSRSPVNLGGVHFSKDLDWLSIDRDGVGDFIMGDFLRGTAVGGIVLVHVLHVLHRDEGIIDGDNVDIFVSGSSAHDKARP